MSSRYRYGYKSRWQKIWHGSLVVTVLSGILLGIGIVVKNSLINDQPVVATGSAQVVGKVLGDSTDGPNATPIDGPFFSFTFPDAWDQTARVDSATQDSYTWSTTSLPRGITLTLYIDTIPTNTAVNLVLPVQAQDNGLTWGQLSDNCTNFTTPPSSKTTLAVSATWQGVPFICDYAGTANNVLGTSSVGNLNSVSVVGPKQGTHKYFFLYTDNSAEPNYATFYSVLSSFQAK